MITPTTNTTCATPREPATPSAPPKPTRQASVRISSLDQNPASGMIPASDNAPIVNVQNVHGMTLRRPPISLRLLVWIEWMIDPAARNSSALKKACVNRWKIPAV